MRDQLAQMKKADSLRDALRALAQSLKEEQARSKARKSTELVPSKLGERVRSESSNIYRMSQEVGLLNNDLFWEKGTYDELRRMSSDLVKSIEDAEKKIAESKEQSEKARERRDNAIANIRKFIDIVNAMNPQL